MHENLVIAGGSGTIVMRPSQEAIRAEAHSRWEDRVREDDAPIDGYELDDWLGSENDLTFQMNYIPLAEYELGVGAAKLFIGSKDHRKCRYCGAKSPATSFKKRAHAISHLLGNKSLFSNDECDDCNTLFSETGEDSLGKMLIPTRALLCISGAKGVPSVKSCDQQFRLDHNRSTGGFSIKDTGSKVVLRHDLTDRTLTGELPTQPFVPVRILKGLTKMAMAIMPEHELVHCKRTLEWLRIKDDHKWLDEIREGMTYFSILPSAPPPTAGLYKRVGEDTQFPVFMFRVESEGLSLQTYVPLCDLDDKDHRLTMSLPRLGHMAFYPDPPTQWSVIPVKSTALIKDAGLEVKMQYERAEEV